ncbi:MAG TPA: PrsW family glutamic-type intramembrane protease [Blastocatellia bacterium]
MLRLIIQNGTNSGAQLHLEQGWLMLGRGEESVLRFVEPSVSTRHAIISTEQDEFFVLDQNSRNGTFLNGERIQTARLASGDVIELGPFGPRLHVMIDPRKQLDSDLSDAETSPQFGDTARLRSPQTAQWTIREAAQTIGLYNPDHDSGDSPPSASIAGLALFCGVMGIIVLALTFLNFGVTVSVIAGVTAFVPAAIYLGMFLWLDRYDPEPVRNLAFAFAWGAMVAIFVSGVVNELFKLTFEDDFLTSVISAPLVEEGSKAMGVLLIALLFRRDFDSVVDGIIYAGVVALGFATMENVGYYGDSLVKEGAPGLIGTFIVRGLFAPFSHVLFTCMTGIGIGIARETHTPVLRVVAPLIGYCVAMFLHALWNTLASFSAGVFWLGYLLLELPLFLGMICVIVVMVRREGRILKQMLATEVEKGLISREQLETAISVFRRSRWVLSAFGNREVFDARRQFLRAIAKLGLCQWHGARALAASGKTGSFSLIPKLRAEIFRLRDQIG